MKITKPCACGKELKFFINKFYQNDDILTFNMFIRCTNCGFTSKEALIDAQYVFENSKLIPTEETKIRLEDFIKKEIQ